MAGKLQIYAGKDEDGGRLKLIDDGSREALVEVKVLSQLSFVIVRLGSGRSPRDFLRIFLRRSGLICGSSFFVRFVPFRG